MKISKRKNFIELVGVLAVREIKSRYKGSLLGPLWVILYPLILTYVTTLVFSRVIKLTSTDLPYFVFVLSGLISWNYFTKSLSLGTKSLVFNRQLIVETSVAAEAVLEESYDQLEVQTEITQQTNVLLFLTCLEGKPSLWEGTFEFLKELKEKRGFTGEFSRPFQRFISQRLRIFAEPRSAKGYENIEDTQKVLELLQQNSDFFYDLLLLQEFFQHNISPIMPLNATWNPELTRRFRVKNAAGLWYIYSHNFRSEYVELMKKHLSSEWTGFNRFVAEPWETLMGQVNTQGNLVDIGSSIGISAFEIAQVLDMRGTIILLDFYNPYRDTSSLRIIDYSSSQRRLITFAEAFARMEALRGNRVVVQLFSVDIGSPLSRDVQEYIQNASLVHLGNILPYIPSRKLNYTLTNSLEATGRDGGILKIHNDESLPTDSLLTSITIQRNGSSVRVLRDLIKGRVTQ